MPPHLHARLASFYPSSELTPGSAPHLRLVKWLFFAVLMAYLYQGIVPAFNQDDLNQLSTGTDGVSILGQGRWGYYLVFSWLQDSNGWPLIATLSGCAMLVFTHLLAARHLGFTRALPIAAFVLIGSISLYYAQAFDFDSTRLAYPLANVFAATGVYLLGRQRYLWGVLALAIAPALYPAATQFAGTLWLCGIVLALVRNRADLTWRRTIIQFILLGVALVLYMAITQASSWVFGYTLYGRASVSLTAAINNFDVIKGLFSRHAIPFITGKRDAYQTGVMVWASGLLTILFACHAMARCWVQGRRGLAPVVAVLVVGLLIAPFSLIFASATDYYPTRALYSYALVFGFFAAALLDHDAGAGARRMAHAPSIGLARPIAAALLGCVLVIAHAAQISRLSFDQYWQSEADLLETSRIITAIDQVIATTPLATASEIPLVVIYDRSQPSPVRGFTHTAAQSEWSRAIIYRFLDARFKPGEQANARQRAAAKGRAAYPAAGSIFVDDGAVIVIRNQVP